MKISKLVKRIFLILLLTVVAIGIISPRGLVALFYYPTAHVLNSVSVFFENRSRNNRKIYYAQANRENLTADMKKGRGPYLTEMGNLLNVQFPVRADFYALAKNRFAQFVTADISAEQLVEKLQAEVDVLNESYIKQSQFIVENDFDLMADMARGEGQYLAAMADLMGVPAVRRSSFYARVKAKFPQLVVHDPAYSNSDSTGQLIEKLHAELADNLAEPIVASVSASPEPNVDVPDENLSLLVCRYWSMLIVDLRYQNSDPWAAMADLLAVPDAKKPAFHALVKSKFSNLDADYHPDYFGGCLTTDHDPTKARQFVSQLKTEAAKL